MKKILSLFIVMSMITALLPFGASVAESADDFPLFSGGAAADIYVYADDYKQVLRAAEDLKEDVNRVTSVLPSVKNAQTELGEYAVIVGSIDKSPLIKQLIDDGKLEEAKAITGKFEAFVIKTIDNPAPGVKKALVIAGSDKRGAIYGIYDLSQQIGVSPYYWWADVTPKVQNEILIPNTLKLEGEPSVKYRGIFLNDEKNFTEWSAQFKDAATPGAPNAGAYEKVFELLLRLGANTLWPAMHSYSEGFNTREDAAGASINAKLADDYGIVMGSSHCEMLLRNNEAEWSRWAGANVGKYDAKGTPVYDYTINPKAVLAYWRERVEKNKDFEGIYNVGMRGIHDQGIAFGGISNPTIQQKVKVLEEIITEQRKILTEVLGKPANEIPQAFIPYKEVAEIYNAGMNMPQDVILMWAEDNHGYLRQISTPAEKARSGGSGVYYHVSYWGIDYTSYLWLNTTPLSLMYEELKKAYDTGAKEYWILNVGDLKPSEISIEFMMGMGRNVGKYDDTTISNFIAEIAKRDFLVDDETAEEIADIMAKYYQYNNAKRPEFQGFESGNKDDTYDIVNYGDEGQIRIDQMSAIFERAQRIYDGLDESRKDAFYQMVYYPLRAGKFNLEMNIYWQKNQLYKQQGRFNSVTKYMNLAAQAYYNIINDLIFYNKTMQNGKWDKMMNPYNAKIPAVVGLRALATVGGEDAVSGIGTVCEGQQLPSDDVTLTFSSLTNDKRFIDIFSKEAAANNWTVEVSSGFIVPTKRSGSVDTEERIWLAIDWNKAAEGVNRGTVTVKDEKGFSKTFNISANKSTADLSGRVYAEANGFVAIEAEHYTESVAKRGSEWRVVKNLGRNGDSMKVFPDDGSRIDDNFDENSAQLKYDIYFENTGTFTGTVYRLPTLNEGNEGGITKTCRLAVGMEGTAPSVLSGVATAVNVSNAWKMNTLAQIEKLTFTVIVDRPGIHTLVVYKSDSSIAIDRIVINTGGLKKSYLGPPESFNTIFYENAALSALPEYTKPSEPEFIDVYKSSNGDAEKIKVTDYISINPDQYIVLDADLKVKWNTELGSEYVNLMTRADGSAVVSGINAGRAIIKVTCDEQPLLSRYLEVNVPPQAQERQGEFLESNGKVLIDITSALEQSKFAGYKNSTTTAWQLNGACNALSTQPDMVVMWAKDTTATTALDGSRFLNAFAPRLDYQIYFEKAGRYYVHTLSSHTDDSSDSLHIGLDGMWQFHTNYNVHTGDMRWEKRDSEWFITVDKPGLHTLNIWGREDGTVSHRIFLTDQINAPYYSGWGPEQSERRNLVAGDSSALSELVNASSEKQQGKYTKESWAVFKAAFERAMSTLSNTYAPQSELDTAYTALTAAAAALVKITYTYVSGEIEKLPDLFSLKLSDKQFILSAREHFNALSAADKNRVGNIEKLSNLERDLAVLEADPDGDVAGTGSVGAQSLIMVRGSILGLEKLTAAQIHRGDLSKDGKLSIADILRMRSIILMG